MVLHVNNTVGTKMNSLAFLTAYGALLKLQHVEMQRALNIQAICM